VNAVAALLVVAVLGRAVVLLLENPEETHAERVSTTERRATTVVGVPLLLVGLSTMVDGPLAIPYDPLYLTFLGLVLTVYPDFTPSSLG
jgi:hypothetical protein